MDGPACAPFKTALAAVAVAGTLAVGVPAGAQGPEADAAATRLTARLAADLSLTEAETNLLAEPVRKHLFLGGREQSLRSMLEAALGVGCRGPCAAETVRAMNRARAAGLSFMDAQRMVEQELAAAGGEAGGKPPTDTARAEALKTRMDARLGAWVPGTEPVPEAPPSPPSNPSEGWPPKRPRLF